MWIGYDERNTTWEDGTVFSWTSYTADEPNLLSDYCTVLVAMLERRDGEYGWADMDCSMTAMSLCQLQDPGKSLLWTNAARKGDFFMRVSGRFSFNF